MNTLDMINKAKETREVYVSGDMYYSYDKGFYGDVGNKWKAHWFEFVDDIMNRDDWKLSSLKNTPLHVYNVGNYNTWNRDELLYEVKRLQSELEKTKKLKRLTDDRFVGTDFYLPKTKEERKEIQLMYKPSYDELYQRLGEYEQMFERVKEGYYGNNT